MGWSCVVQMLDKSHTFRWFTLKRQVTKQWIHQFSVLSMGPGFTLYPLLFLFEETVHITNVTFKEMLFLMQLWMVNHRYGSRIPDCSSQMLLWLRKPDPKPHLWSSWSLWGDQVQDMDLKTTPVPHVVAADSWKYCPFNAGLFEKHKLLFSFNMTVRIEQADGRVPQEELEFFLKGKVNIYI